DLGPGVRGLAAAAEDLDALGVVPVVDDVAEDVGVGAGDRVEEAAGLGAAAVGEGGGGDDGGGALDDAGEVEDDAAGFGGGAEDFDEGGRVAAADVGDGVEGGEVVGLDHGGGFGAVDGGHGLVEAAAVVGALGEVVEDGCAEDLVEAGAAGFDGVGELREGGVAEVADHEGGGVLRAGDVGAQALAQLGVGEAAGGGLGEDADGGEGAQEAVEGFG